MLQNMFSITAKRLRFFRVGTKALYLIEQAKSFLAMEQKIFFWEGFDKREARLFLFLKS